MKPIVDELAELRALDAHELAARYETLFGRPPRSRHRELLFRKCAWRVQELRYGGLSTTAKKKLDELMSEIELPSEPKPQLVALITREWRGKQIVVRPIANGFEYEGATFRSLSAIAKHITGSHQSGNRFFGLAQESRRA